MKKILIVIDHLAGFGAERVLKDLLKYLDKSKYDIEILLNQKQGVFLEKISENHKVMSLNKSRENYSKITIFKKMKTLYLVIKTNILSSSFFSNRIISDKYDIEIAFLQGGATKFVAGRKNKAKKIAWVHSDLERLRDYDNKNKKEIYGKFDKIVAVSKDSAKSIENLYPEYKNKIEVVLNPVDVEFIKEKSTVEKINFPVNVFNLLSVGRLVNAKGYDILLKAHKELMEEGIKHNLYIIGNGAEEKKLKEYINKNELQESVTLLGYKSNPYPYMLSSNGFVMSSRYEGYPLVLTEALVLGKPIVATKCTGPNEMLENGKYGIMVEVENVKSLKEGIKELITCEGKKDYYSRASSVRSKMFDIKETIKQVEEIFDNI